MISPTEKGPSIFAENKHPLILIVDDTTNNLRLIGNLLREAKYSVSFAQSGVKALSIAEERKPDLVLLDIQMPGIDGFEICQKLKRNQTTEHIPVLFLTAKSDADDIIKGFDSGAVDYITKPFHQKELLVRIKTHLDLKFAKEKIEWMSYYDELSGIPNKRYFNRFFEMEWNLAIREKTFITVILADIDLFKNYNDTYGHMEGDKCIFSVAKALNNCTVRPTDFVARFGGEEFICVLPNTDPQGAVYVAEKMMKSIRGMKIPHKGSTVAHHITLSFGVSSLIPQGDSDMMEFISRADSALYQSKRLGRNQVSIL